MPSIDHSARVRSSAGSLFAAPRYPANAMASDGHGAVEGRYVRTGVASAVAESYNTEHIVQIAVIWYDST
jgi:hypothetical protein